MVEEETPSLIFEMSRIFVKLFLVTGFCSREMSAHFPEFSPKMRKWRETKAHPLNGLKWAWAAGTK